MKKVKNYILAFVIPFLICFLVFLYKGIINNPDLFLVSDLRSQFIPFYSYLQSIFKGESSLFYSFYAGIGSSMFSTLIFYCFSPINILLLFIKDVRYAALFIYLVKVGLAGLTMYVFLKSKVTSREKFITILFSTCYALSSFMVCYCFCIFWLDCIYMAPIVLLGIDKIILNKRFNFIYIFSLSIAIASNIQMGFGLCVFSLIYYIYSMVIMYDFKKERDKYFRISFIFIVSSIISALICGVTLLGFISEFSNIRTKTNQMYVSNIIYIIKNLFSVGNLTGTYLNNYEPYIYSGLVISFLSVLYFFNKNINIKERKASFVVILIFIFSFCIPFLNYFWHLSIPIELNFRYSGYLGLFLIYLAHKNYYEINNITTKDKVLLFVSSVIGLLCCFGYIDKVYILYTVIFMVLVIFFLIFSKNKKNIFVIGLYLIILIEVVINLNYSFYLAGDITVNNTKRNFTPVDNVKYNDYKKFCEWTSGDNDYKVLYNFSYTSSYNDSIICSKNSSIGYFSSIINKKLVLFFNRVGSTTSINYYMYPLYDAPLINSLFGVKYLYTINKFVGDVYDYDSEKIFNNYDYKLHKKYKQSIYSYVNPYALSLGYIIDGDVKYNKKMNLIDYQNSIVKGFTGIEDDVIVKINYTHEENNTTCGELIFGDAKSCFDYTFDNDNYVFYVNDLDLDGVSYGDIKGLSVNNDVSGVNAITGFYKNPKLIISFKEEIDPEFLYAYSYDKKVLGDVYNKLSENQVYDVIIDKNKLNGHINAKKSGILFLSIPYDKNFNVYVDNKKVNYYGLLNDTFIGLDIESGEHEISLEYIDNRYIIYIGVSLVGIILSIFVVLIFNKKYQKQHLIELELEKERLLKEEARKNKKKNKKKSNKK